MPTPSIPVVSVPERRAEVTARIQAETGIDEAMIEQLMRGFYARVRDDALLGPIFETRIADWEPHLRQMTAFWSSVALLTGRYHGQPMPKHLPCPSAPSISTDGSGCSKPKPGRSVRRRPPTSSSIARGVSLPRSNSESRVGAAYC